ncbi:MAG: hypothetical protein DIU70_002925 [Bacillota bacterium]|nr:MAG: hypothetical protein DIU70_13365 [Bacillota bacterium]
MLITGQVGIGFRCPFCGEVQIHPLTLFALSGRSRLVLECPCGEYQAEVERQRGRVVLRLPCFPCGEVHTYVHPPALFWSGELLPLVCPHTDLQAGAVGDPGLVEGFIEPLDLDCDHGAEPDYFVNPEVMYEVLAAVHELDEAGRLRCRCGSREIGYELQPDRLELVCSRCGARQPLTAVTEADADRARRTRRLEIGGARGGPGRAGPSGRMP